MTISNGDDTNDNSGFQNHKSNRLRQGCTNFANIQEPPKTARRQKDSMKHAHTEGSQILGATV